MASYYMIVARHKPTAFGGYPWQRWGELRSDREQAERQCAEYNEQYGLLNHEFRVITAELPE